jgi:hypothetical protein
MAFTYPNETWSAFCGWMVGPLGAQTSSEVKGLVELESICWYWTVLQYARRSEDDSSKEYPRLIRGSGFIKPA